MTIIRTPRLLLIPATGEALSAELISPQALGDLLAVDVPPSWPPELYDADAIRWTISWLGEHPDERGWSLYYVATASRSASDRPRLVGIAGYKGQPDAAGEVEIGYGIVPESRRQGFASEAVRALVARAFGDARVTSVIAHTLPELAASIGVLRTTGFLFDGPGNDPEEPAAIRFVFSRSRYDEMRRTLASASLGQPPRKAPSSLT